MMSTTSSPDDNEILWNQLAPHLDQAVAALSETDRSAILLRFYEKKPLREVGQRLGDQRGGRQETCYPGRRENA